MPRADGTLVTQLIKATTLDTPDGVMLMGVGLDITSRVQAQAALRESIVAPPHQVITDVVLPKKNDRQLFEQLLARLPNIRVHYMSGYSDETVTHHGVLNSGVVLLQKPFSVEQLLTKVRLVLDA